MNRAMVALLALLPGILAPVLQVPVAQEQQLPDPQALGRQALAEFSRELTECAAYYLISAEANFKRRISRAAQAEQWMAGALLERAVKIGVEEQVMAQARLALKRLELEALPDLSEISMLTNRYGVLCRQAFDDPEARMVHWRETIRSRR